MTVPQFITCKFRPRDSRTYTYRNDGPPVRVGDAVRVPSRDDQGWQVVTVAEIDVSEPRLPNGVTCKAIKPTDSEPQLPSEAENDYRRRLNEAHQLAGQGGDGWNDRFLRALKDRGLGLAPIGPDALQPPKPHYVQAPQPYGEGWADSWLVEVDGPPAGLLL